MAVSLRMKRWYAGGPDCKSGCKSKAGPANSRTTDQLYIIWINYNCLSGAWLGTTRGDHAYSNNQTAMANDILSQHELLVVQGGLMADLGQQQSLLPPWTLIEAFQHRSIAYTCVVAFAAEGNNAPDAMRVADAVNQYLHLLIQQQPQPNGRHHASKGVMSLPPPWLAPLSWKYVYGPASSRGFY